MENSSAYYDYLSSRAIQFQRRAPERLLWANLKQSRKLMGTFTVEKHETIENTPKTYAKVIFLKSNVIGANIFSNNPICRQEEIFVLSCPELLVGFVLLEQMQDNEAITISDFDQYVSCIGIDFNFSCGDVVRKQNLSAIAISAANYKTVEQQQYSVDCMLKDLNKAFAGFTACSSEKFNRNSLQYQSIQTSTNSKQSQLTRSHSAHEWSAGRTSNGQINTGQACIAQADLIQTNMGKTSQSFKAANRSQALATTAFTNTKFPTSVATGNWGCGELGGDPQLKLILQWIAMTEAGCNEILYCTLDDYMLVELGRLENEIKECSVETIIQLLDDYAQNRRKYMHKSISLFDYLIKSKKTKIDKRKKKCSVQ